MMGRLVGWSVGRLVSSEGDVAGGAGAGGRCWVGEVEVDTRGVGDRWIGGYGVLKLRERKRWVWRLEDLGQEREEEED
jgi:hypothetical protein